MIFLKNFVENKTLETDLSQAKSVEDMIVHTIYFPTKEYKEKSTVEKFLKLEGFKNYIIGKLDSEDKNEQRYYAHFVKQSQRNAETSTRVELKDGMIIYGNNLRVCELGEDENNSQIVDLFNCSDLKEENGLPTVIELAKTVKGDHPWYGEVKIDKDHIKEMKKNFSNKSHGIDVAINLDHKRENAVGWVDSVATVRNDNRLIGSIKWNNKGLEILENKEYRYISPEIRYNYKHHLTKKEHGTVLTGAALTNYPFLQMKPVVKMDQKEDIESINKKRSFNMDEETKKDQSKANELELKLKDSEHRNKELENEVKNLNNLIHKSIAEAKHQKLFSEGKITAAQLNALNEGKDPLDVIDMNVTVKATQSGTSEAKEGQAELTLAQKEAMRKLGIKDEKYYKMFMK